ncbi:MAG: DnaJ domain-containing protein [Methyloprofundus sp.]|nr:DnaJ domain-containing protein [Methyloprofundus sp.]
MIRIYLLLAIIAICYWVICFSKKTASERKQYTKRSFYMLLVFIFLALALMGRLHWLIAALGGLVAVVLRFLPVALRYMPQIQKIIQLFYQSKFSTNKPNQAAKPSANLSKQEACDILGVAVTATKQDIIDAHRKLMLKNHPDRGGSAHLAAQINQAKDSLLQK